MDTTKGSDWSRWWKIILHHNELLYYDNSLMEKLVDVKDERSQGMSGKIKVGDEIREASTFGICKFSEIPVAVVGTENWRFFYLFIGDFWEAALARVISGISTLTFCLDFNKLLTRLSTAWNTSLVGTTWKSFLRLIPTTRKPTFVNFSMTYNYILHVWTLSEHLSSKQ